VLSADLEFIMLYLETYSNFRDRIQLLLRLGLSLISLTSVPLTGMNGVTLETSNTAFSHPHQKEVLGRVLGAWTYEE